MQPIRLGIVGLGAMGTEMLAAAVTTPEFTVVRAFDVSPAAVEGARAAYPGIAFASDIAEIVLAPDIDAIYFATPPASHAEGVTAAIQAGKAVFCEKPLAISLADGRRMTEAAERHKVAAAVNFALSDRAAVLEVERALLAGELGEVRGVGIRLSFPQWPRGFQAHAGWLAGREQGGFVREVLSHFVYLTDRLLGPVDAIDVSADAPHTDPRASEVAARGYLLAGNVPVHVSAFAGVAGPELYEWTLHGTHRSYLLRDWGELLMSDGGAWTPVTLAGPRGSESTRLSLFAAAIRGEHPRSLADFPAALRVQTVVETFHRLGHVSEAPIAIAGPDAAPDATAETPKDNQYSGVPAATPGTAPRKPDSGLRPGQTLIDRGHLKRDLAEVARPPFEDGLEALGPVARLA
jgi:predicted dehydrogenase